MTRPVLRPGSLPSIAALLGLLGSGCAPHAVRPNEYRAWVNGFGFGMIGPRAIDLRDVCPRGEAADFEVHSTALTVGLSVVSLGVYTPRQVAIRCR